MSDHLQRLMELTPLLSDIVTGRYGKYPECMVEYGTEQGACLGHGLYSSKDIAVQRAFLSNGSIMKKHKHKSKEIIIVYKGVLTISIDGKDTRINPGELYVIHPGTEHTVSAEGDVWCIGITIPSEEGYPDAK